MKYAKVRPVKTLSRGTKRSAGIDFYMPVPTTDFVKRMHDLNGDNKCFFTKNALIITAHSHVLIPSGIVTNLQSSKNFLYSETDALALIAHNKSSVGIKQLDVAATVIDEDYQGEIHLSLTNTSDRNVALDYECKVVQFILVPILIEQFEQVEVEELFQNDSERSTGAFGSTGQA